MTMPTPVKRSENMTKHLTRAEREAREVAEGSLQRKGRVQIRAPKWLGGQARKVFNQTKRRMAGLGLLDTADADLLGLYADAVARYQATVEDWEHMLKGEVQEAQAWSRLALSYAEKLGISATGRARLARKKMERQLVDELDELLDDVSDFVNGEG
jgi:phage terminase small subunit